MVSTVEAGSLCVILPRTRLWFCSGLSGKDGCRVSVQKKVEGEIWREWNAIKTNSWNQSYSNTWCLSSISVIWSNKNPPAPLLYSLDDRWIFSCDSFLQFEPLSAFLHIQVCVDGMYSASSQKGTRGDRASCTSLSPPQQSYKTLHSFHRSLW